MGLHIADLPLDYAKRSFNWNRQYIVDTDSMRPERSGKPLKDGEFQVYTDGSKEEENSGAAFLIIEMPEETVICEKIVHLGDTTVGQCETYAIGAAAAYISDTPEMFRGKSIVLYTDSQSTLRALDKTEISSSNTLKTVQ